ncbi:NAD-dependent epimerase/dehydratase family protein [Candidatus Lokiarchaeum ossiferum]|uniref:NAD-dependent epimerase/dehydratase family protein n=1 Tax=Candidatus Lokiarchaeum ossiferum TaxID=2951803 RepID=UPI00352EDB13
MRILVTGSSGFLGNAIKKYLTNQGFDIYGTTRSNVPVNEAWILRSRRDNPNNLGEFQVFFLMRKVPLLSPKKSSSPLIFMEIYFIFSKKYINLKNCPIIS